VADEADKLRQALTADRVATAAHEVTANPKSANAWFQLASARLDEKNFAGVKEALEQLFRLEPDHQGGRVLERIVALELRQVTPEEAVAGAVGSLEASKNALEPAVKDAANKELSQDQRRSELDEKYGISAYPVPDTYSPALFERAKQILELRRGERYKELERLLREDVDAEPKRHQARMAIIVFLVQQDRFDDAKRELDAALAVLPNFPDLAIVKDNLPAIERAANGEQRNEVRRRMERMLLDANAIRLDKVLMPQ
jgi:tetratricopeptide (TPR) repeat protein